LSDSPAYPLQTPQLYHTINLSSHNANIACEPWAFIKQTDALVHPDFVAREWTDYDKAIFFRQEMLLRTFTADQDLGKYVKTLCWTVLDTSEISWGQAIYVDSDLEGASDDSQEPSAYTPEDGESCDVFVAY
jgi:hypothetical protein